MPQKQTRADADDQEEASRAGVRSPLLLLLILIGAGEGGGEREGEPGEEENVVQVTVAHRRYNEYV